MVAVSVTDERDSVDRVLGHQQLESLRVAIAKDWQGRFGLSEGIPQTVVVERGRVRVVHVSQITDPVAYLEADLAALRTSAAR